MRAGVGVMDININPELRKEGIARDLVNRVQNMRKDMGLEVQDKIRIAIQKNEGLVNSALEEYGDYICRETQALALEILDEVVDGISVELDDLNLVLKIRKN